ncbi:MAG: hypothetical protein PVH26_09655 [Desulfosarcina sp.]|jgi:hypothetical protein
MKAAFGATGYASSLDGKMTIMDEATFLNVLKMTVEKHGCTIVDLDLENHIINLDGPEDAVGDCARAIAELVKE